MVARGLLVVASALLMGSSALGGVGFSGATWTSSTVAPVAVTAAEWTPPVVALVDLDFTVSGVVPVTATASDTQSGVASVEIQFAPTGTSTWTSICVDTTSPYTCDWNTVPLAEAVYDLRAVATDADANTATSARITTEVANTPGVVIDPVSSPTGGVVALTGRVVNVGAVPSTITFQYAVSGGSVWTDMAGCVALTGPTGSCSFNTGGATGLFDMRAVGVANATTYYDVQAGILVDNTPPVVTLVVPPGTLSGTVGLTATATDVHTSVSSVTFQHRLAPSGPWASSCPTDSIAPYTCDLDTTALADGTYDFRASAVDAAGTVGLSTVTTSSVQNSYVELVTLPSVLKGTVSVSATWHGPGTPVVTLESSADGANPWPDICAGVASPTLTCSWNTTSLATAQRFVRAFATVSGVDYLDSQTVMIDNTAPTAALTVPTGTLNGTVQLTATASDVGSGVTGVRFEYKLSSAPTWSTCGTDTSAPYSCALDTALLVDGSYVFQAVATDGAGTTFTTATQTRTVDNTTPWVRVTSPVTGSLIAQGVDVVVTADAFSGTGITSVALQHAPTGTTSWTTICTDSVAPYSCSWETVAVPPGGTDLRAVMTRPGGATTTSPTVLVTIKQLQAVDVQATPVEGIASNVIPGAGDEIRLTYSARIAPTSIRAGWDGLPASVALRLNDKGFGTPAIAGKDWLQFTDANLGQVAFTQNYVAANASVLFTGSTMRMISETVDGVERTVVVITLGTPDPLTAGKLNLVADGIMTWTPSTAATSLDGSTCLATAANESGTSDKDL